MAVSTLSFIISFLLFIIFSPFVDEKAIAAQMEHRKLGGAKETMAMRRNLEGNGHEAKIATPRSVSPHGRQKNTDKEPSKTKPDQTTTQGQPHYLSYKSLQKPRKCDTTASGNCIGRVTHGAPCVYSRCKRQVP